MAPRSRSRTASLSLEIERDSCDKLLVDARNGSDAAFAALSTQYGGQMFGLALRILRQHHEAEDAVQQSFAQIVRGLARFQAGRGTGRAWIMQIVRNVAISRCRELKNERARSLNDVEEPRAVPKPPVDVLIQKDDAKRLRREIRRLRKPYRESIEQRYFEGLSVPEMAARMNCKESTIRTRLHRAHLALARQLKTMAL
jgi:RNA polymerase sigma-70 factor (ECF subfamily)